MLVAEAALKTSTILGLAAITISAMQGVLGLESSHPVRLSWRKTKFMLGLEFLFGVCLLVAEALTFIEARAHILRGLRNLAWAPGVIVTLGVLQFIRDAAHTIHFVTASRAFWIPFCELPGASPVEYGGLVLVSGLSFMLVGWRQRWWLAEKIVLDLQQVRTTRSLHPVLIGICVGVAFFAMLLAAVHSAVHLLTMEHASMWGIFHLRNTAKWKKDNQRGDRMRQNYMHIDRARLERQFLAVVHMQQGDQEIRGVDHDLQYVPLHVQNLILGEDRKLTLNLEGKRWTGRKLQRSYNVKKVLGILEMLAAIPILCQMVVAIVRLHRHFDKDSFLALRELVDVVLMFVAAQIAFAVKRLLWGFKGCTQAEIDGEGEQDHDLRYEKEKDFPKG